MNLLNSILKVLIYLAVFEAASASQVATKNSLLKVKDSSISWENMTERLVTMMLNSDVAQTKESINVLIFMMINKKTSSDFQGMNQALSKATNERITFVIEILNFFPTKTRTYKSINIQITFEFVVILMHSSIEHYSHFIDLNFEYNIPDKSINLFLIMIGTANVNKVFNQWGRMVMMGYFNIYIMLQDYTGTFEMFRPHLYNNAFEIRKSQDLKYLTTQNFPNVIWLDIIHVIYYNSYFTSYYKYGKIIGIEGQLIEEFSKKLKLPYKILNKHPEKIAYQDAISALSHGIVDICLSTSINLFGRSFDRAVLNEMDGLCLLTPRNIPVSSYNYHKLPLDIISLVMSFVSTIAVIVTWKITSNFTDNRRSIKSITIAVVKITFNVGPGIERLSKKEIILVYSFMFSSIILISFYESVILVFMFVSPTWRSAYDLKELNDTGARFFTFYTKNLARRSLLPYVREELIINSVDLSTMKDLMIPEKFDENLVYLVSCRYADSFVRSTKNINNEKRLFDKIKITEMFQSYPIRKGFTYGDEFKQIVENLIESGIYKFWLKEFIQKSLSNTKKVKDDSEIHIIMKFPLILLVVGCSIAFVVFLYENIFGRCKIQCVNQVGIIKLQNKIAQSKPKLTKWMNRYLYKKRLNHPTYDPISHKKEIIKCRESISGGYFVFKKIRKIRKAKQFPRIIDVRPYCSNESFL